MRLRTKAAERRSEPATYLASPDVLTFCALRVGDGMLSRESGQDIASGTVCRGGRRRLGIYIIDPRRRIDDPSVLPPGLLDFRFVRAGRVHVAARAPDGDTGAEFVCTFPRQSDGFRS